MVKLGRRDGLRPVNGEKRGEGEKRAETGNTTGEGRKWGDELHLKV